MKTGAKRAATLNNGCHYSSWNRLTDPKYAVRKKQNVSRAFSSLCPGRAQTPHACLRMWPMAKNMPTMDSWNPWDMHPSPTWSIRLIWKEPQCGVLEGLLQFIIKSNIWTFHLKQLDLIHSIGIFKEMPLINLWAISGQEIGRNETMYSNIYFIH